MTILITGARGAIARNLTELLVRAGESVRVASREPGGVTHSSQVEPILVDFARPETVADALRGVTKVFTYAAEHMDNFVAAANDAGVQHIVLLSSGNAGSSDDDEIARMHNTAEAALRESGIAWTFVRPGMFATNALWWRQSIKDEGVVRLPYPDALVRPIHEGDIAEVAFIALTTAGYENSVIPIDGAQQLSQRRQVELIAQESGNDIEVRQLPHEVAEKFLPKVMLEMLASPTPPPAGPTSEAVTGKPARGFAQWAQDHAADFAK